MTWFAVCDVDGCGLAAQWDNDEEMDTWRIQSQLRPSRAAYDVMRDRHFCPDHVETP